LITTAKPTDDATHSGPGGRTLASVARYRTANRSQRSTSTGALQDIRL
jgi:hypothetical protein